MPPADLPAPVPRAGSHRPAVIAFFLITLVMLAADLTLKHWSFNHVAHRPIGLTAANAHSPDLIPPHEGLTIVPSVLQLRLTVNHGAVFGLGGGGRWFFIAITFVAIAVITAMFWRSPRNAWLMHIALALILAGALGNLYDRLRFGVVRDMLHLFPGVKLPFGWQWPGGIDELYPWIFNIADVSLCVGVVIIVVLMLRSEQKGEKKARA